MAYPPTVPSNSRANSTAAFDNHAADHNAVADALTDILSELGSAPKGGFADVAARLANLLRAASGVSSQLLQHGRKAGTTDADGLIAVTFAEAYSSTPTVVLTRDATSSNERAVQLYSASTTGFSARIMNAGSPLVSSTADFTWIAVGTKT